MRCSSFKSNSWAGGALAFDGNRDATRATFDGKATVRRWVNGVQDATFSGGNHTFTVDDIDGDLSTPKGTRAGDTRPRSRRPRAAPRLTMRAPRRTSRVIISGRSCAIPLTSGDATTASSCASIAVVHLAQMMARAVVPSDVGDLGSSVRHGETGLLVPTGDVAAPAHALEQTLPDRDAVRRFGEALRRRVLTASSWDMVATRVEAALRAVPRLARAQAAPRP